MLQFLSCTFGVPLHFKGLAERIGDRVEIDHLTFSGGVPIEWRLHDENGPVKLKLFDDSGWMDAIPYRQSLPFHDLQIHDIRQRCVRGIPAKSLWLETRGIGDASVCVSLRIGTYKEIQDQLPIIQARPSAVVSSDAPPKRPKPTTEQKAAYLVARTDWVRGGSVGISPATEIFGVMFSDFTSDEMAAADDAGDPRPSGVSSWTWNDPEFRDQLRWHHAVRKASNGGVVFTTEELKVAEAYYTNKSLILTF